LEGASLEVGAGQFVSLVGPSGSGKSSLLRVVIGLQRPLSGKIESEFVASELGILFQDDALLPWRTARDNVALGLGFRGMDRRRALEAADEWLDRFGLSGFGDRYPRHLSGGQRKRVAIAQAMALKPKLLLMDEPFASLDAIVRARISQEVVELVEREKISVLLVTHDLEEAIALSDAVYLLSQGPRARVTQRYSVPIPRPRDLVRAKTHPAFAPLLEKLWADLSREVDMSAGAEKAEAA
jgi:NitT/TauT family transport system ATP-binding protein